MVTLNVVINMQYGHSAVSEPSSVAVARRATPPKARRVAPLCGAATEDCSTNSRVDTARNLAVVVASLFLSTTSPAATFQSEFMWRMPLRDSVVSGRLYRIKTPPELFDGSVAFPSDLRILDAQTNQWPYFLWIPAPVEEVAPVPFEMLNRSMVESGERHLRQDLRIAADGERRTSGRPPPCCRPAGRRPTTG